MSELKKIVIMLVGCVMCVILGAYFYTSMALEKGSTAHLTANSDYTTNPPGNNLASRKFQLLLYSRSTTFEP